jgi:hypothetical protein
MTLISLVYVSYESRTLSDDELRAILESSRRHNQANNITGMLLYRDGFFIQALEGEKDIVESTYARIGTDTRHRNVLMVFRNTIEHRSFSNWMMGFNKVTDATLKELDGFTDYLNQPMDSSFFAKNPSRAKLLLEHFRDKTFF